MRIAIPTTGDDLEAPMAGRLGRAVRFLVIDDVDMTFQVVDNGANADANQGAGIQAAQNLVAAGADRVIATHCGPKAFAVFQAAGVRVYKAEAGLLREILSAFMEGGLKRLDAPEKPGDQR